MKKKEIKKVIFNKIDYKHPIPYRMYKHLIEDSDIVTAGYEETEFTENNGIDGHYYLMITRMVLETDAEYEVRIGICKFEKENLKKRRYENYLKLKEEFENGD